MKYVCGHLSASPFTVGRLKCSEERVKYYEVCEGTDVSDQEILLEFMAV